MAQPVPPRPRVSSNLSTGTSQLSEHLLSATVPSVQSSFVRDLQSNWNVVDYLSFVTGLLCAASTDPTSPMPLNAALTETVSVCENEAIMSAVRAYAEVANGTDEHALYAAFVTLANTCLMVLQRWKEDLGTLRSANDLLFHVNDPRLMVADHRGVQSTRKPDVVGVTHDAAKAAAGEGQDDPYMDTALKTAVKPPQNAIDWDYIETGVEFKPRPNKKRSTPPDKYEFKNFVDQFPPDDVPSEPYAICAPTSTPGPSGAISSSVASASADLEPQEPPVPKGQLATTTPQESTTRRSARISRSSSCKRPPVEEIKRQKPPKLVKQNPAVEASTYQSPHPTVQCALYGAELLSRRRPTAFGIVLLLKGDRVFASWYDREGTIQSRGIDLIQDLPHFVVLLLALQRMGSIGRISELRRKGSGFGELTLNMPKMGPVTLSKQIRDFYGLKGRATVVYKATRDQTDDGCVADPSPEEMVAKINWPQTARTPEGEIIRIGLERANKNKEGGDLRAISDHLPVVHDWCDFPSYSTQEIRRWMGCCQPIEPQLEGQANGTCRCSDRHRVFRVTIFGALQHLTQLQGTEFVEAFRDCYRCNTALWKLGVQHRDISDTNLMFRRHPRLGRAVGVLNDFDLASIAEDGGPIGRDRTGTIRCLSLELLRAWGRGERPEHVWRHDSESFLWALLWICATYRAGELITPLPLALWNDVKQSRKDRSDYLIGGVALVPMGESKQIYNYLGRPWLLRLKNWILQYYDNRDAIPPTDSTEEGAIETFMLEVLENLPNKAISGTFPGLV